MPLSIDDLFTAITEDQALATFIAELEGLGIPASTWRQGGSLRTILRVAARTYAGFSTVMVAAIKSGFLDYAAGVWLTALAYYVFNVQRITATFATGSVVFVNPGGGSAGPFAPGTFRVKCSTSGKVYFNTATFSIAPSSTTAPVPIQAVEVGSASNAVAAGSGNPTIDTLVTMVPNVTVSNPASVVGTDDETDDALRQRCRNKLGALSPNGPRSAYEYAVSAAKRLDGTPVNINRAAVSRNSTRGTVDVWIAAPSGAPDPADVTAVIASIEAISRPDTVTVTVHAATGVPLSTSLTVFAKTTAGLDAPTLQSQVAAALTAMASAYPIGGIAKPPSPQGYLYAGTIEGAAAEANAAIFDVTGEADLILNPGEVPILTAAITVRFVDVAPAFG